VVAITCGVILFLSLKIKSFSFYSIFIKYMNDMSETTIQTTSEPIHTYHLFKNKCDMCTTYSTESMCQQCIKRNIHNRNRYILMTITGIGSSLLSFLAFHINTISSISYGMAVVAVVGGIYDSE